MKLEPFDVQKFNAYQDKFESQWLSVIPCKNLKIKFSNLQLAVAIRLRLGSKVCEKHGCNCGKDVTKMDNLAYLVSKVQSFSRHSNLNVFKKKSGLDSHSFCFRAMTPPQNRSVATKGFDARPMGSSCGM